MSMYSFSISSSEGILPHFSGVETSFESSISSAPSTAEGGLIFPTSKKIDYKETDFNVALNSMFCNRR